MMIKYMYIFLTFCMELPVRSEILHVDYIIM